MFKHCLLVLVCCTAQATFADEKHPTKNSKSNEIAKLTSRIEQLEKRIGALERQNTRKPSVTGVPQYQPYNTPQYQAPRSQPYMPNTNPAPYSNEPSGPRPQYVPQTTPAVPYQPHDPQHNDVPDSWQPFDFNGMRYYIIPVNEAERINSLNQNDRMHL